METQLEFNKKNKPSNISFYLSIVSFLFALIIPVGFLTQIFYKIIPSYLYQLTPAVAIILSIISILIYDKTMKGKSKVPGWISLVISIVSLVIALNIGIIVIVVLVFDGGLGFVVFP